MTATSSARRRPDPNGTEPNFGACSTTSGRETRYEIERERIEQGSGSEEEKERRLAELRAAHEHRRGVHEAQWAEL